MELYWVKLTSSILFIESIILFKLFYRCQVSLPSINTITPCKINKSVGCEEHIWYFDRWNDVSRNQFAIFTELKFQDLFVFLKLAYLIIRSPPGPEVQIFPISSMSNPSGLPFSLNLPVKLINRRGFDTELSSIMSNSQSSWLVKLQLLTINRSSEIAIPFGVTISFVSKVVIPLFAWYW